MKEVVLISWISAGILLAYGLIKRIVEIQREKREANEEERDQKGE